MLNNQYYKQPTKVSIFTLLDSKKCCVTALYRNVLILQLINKIFNFNYTSYSKVCSLISTTEKVCFLVGYFIVLHINLRKEVKAEHKILESALLSKVLA